MGDVGSDSGGNAEAGHKGDLRARNSQKKPHKPHVRPR